jgi:hypothetical protein
VFFTDSVVLLVDNYKIADKKRMVLFFHLNIEPSPYFFTE